MNSKIRPHVRKYDIRGRVSPDFGQEEAYLIGRGFSRILNDLEKKSVVIGHDIRKSSPDFNDALIRGLLESGIKVIDCGLCITPMARFASIVYDSGAFIMITASHNDLSDNGFKFFLNKKPLYGESLSKLCDIIDDRDFVDGVGSIEKSDFLDLYLKNIVNRVIISDTIRAAWVYDNEFMKALLEKLIKMLPGKHSIVSSIELADDYDVAFEFDTDGDRMVLLDKEKDRICGDEALALFAINMKGRNRASKLKAVFDLKASRVLLRWLESIGISCDICQVGSCHIDDRMRSIDADLGGEVSGHFMFKDYNSLSDDGIYSACLMLHYLSSFGGDIAAMRRLLPEVHITKSIRIPCPSSTPKLDLMEKIKKHAGDNKVINGSAIVIQMQEGWIVVRPSETEHALTVRCEGFYKDGLQAVQEKADSLLSIVGLSLW